MSNKNFLNVHVLISHSPSCLNRDDMNMQKSAVFGGVRRVRISSQSLKRAIRQSDYYAEHLGAPSVRTRDLDRLKSRFAEALKSRFDEELVARTIDLIARDQGDSGKAKKGKASAKKAESAAADDGGAGAPDKEDVAKKLAVAPWSVDEVARYCDIVAREESGGRSQKDLKKLVENESATFLAALDNSVDIALSGRMATAGLMSKIDAALSLAHTITTHAVDADIDWFTAVDDLVQDEGDVGAGHLNTQEFGAGVFYRYASLNLRQLGRNIGGATRERALDIAAHLVRMLATVVPEAKQHSFAAYNTADLVLASFADVPFSAANAFEKPVERARKGGGFIEPSIKAFDEYVTRVRDGYSLDEPQAVFSLWDTSLERRFPRLEDIEAWVRADAESAPAGGA